MSINSRILEIIHYSGFSNSEFADAIEVQKASISHIISGRNKPSLEFVIKIKNKFPELSWDWLINGEGEMQEALKSEVKKEVDTTERKPITLPDLFSLVQDEMAEEPNEAKISENETIPKSILPSPTLLENTTADSQELDKIEGFKENDPNKNKSTLKKIVFFYENGRFESFEP